MKRLVLVLCLVLTLPASACSPQALPKHAATPTPAPPPGIAVSAWVDDPTPPLGSDVHVRFHLLNQGVPVNGLDMSATWQQGGHPQWCHVQVQYDIGQCAIRVSDFTPGAYVPITVSVEYVGWIFYGHTGFTPR